MTNIFKKPVVLVLLMTCAAVAFAQQAGEEDIGGADPTRAFGGQPTEELKEISIDKFESDGAWSSRISSDAGFAQTRLFSGGPSGKEAIEDERALELPDQFVLGTRVDFLRRGFSSLEIFPYRPLTVEGIAKTISVWVAGRNYNHSLYVTLQDFKGNRYELYMGRLNFQGWKKLTVNVPSQPLDGKSGIVQRDYHYNSNGGIKITGFRVDFAPMETYGSYYIYFDDLRATTDLFAETALDADDPSDDW
jgi:hypothetical protein